MTILNEPRKRKPPTAGLVARGIGGELEETTIIEGSFATRVVLAGLEEIGGLA
jgi:hypothetical protein